MVPSMADAVASSDSQIPVVLKTIHEELEVFIYNYTVTADDNQTVQDTLPEDVYNLSKANFSDGRGEEGQYVVPRISAEIQIGLYTLIFLLAVVGNLLVLVTLFQNKRMRTVTNVFLLNLALSDLLLAVFCMPFTLVPVILRNFIFGAAMCVLIRYLQAASVGASCFTLVAISLERYFAICRPLHSRTWQTLSHAYRCLGLCWFLAALLMLPVAVFQKHERLPNGAHACRESWPSLRWAQAYTVLLDFALLVLPVFIMSLAYVRVVHALVYDVRTPSFRGCGGGGGGGGGAGGGSGGGGGGGGGRGMDREEEEEVVVEVPSGVSAKPAVPNHRTIELRLLARDSMRSISSVTSSEESVLSRSSTLVTGTGTVSPSRVPAPLPRSPAHNNTASPPRRSARQTNRIRHSNPRKIRENKIRVIRMLFVVVLEFFLCWTPLYVIQTWMIFDHLSAYQFVTPLTKTLFHLLSYVSSCCNPITYCFMNKKFREGFVRVFTCRKPPPPLKERQHQQDNHLVVSLQDSRQGHPLVSVMQGGAVRQFDFVSNVNSIATIEERSPEDGSQS